MGLEQKQATLLTATVETLHPSRFLRKLVCISYMDRVYFSMWNQQFINNCA